MTARAGSAVPEVSTTDPAAPPAPPAPADAPSAAHRLPIDPARRAAGERFCIEAARLCADLRCRNVRVLDVGQLSPVCDFFILATGASQRQMRTVVRDVEDLARQHDLPPLRSAATGEPNDRWTAVDLVDVIVHVFSDEARQFYDLDGLWGDAREIHWAREQLPEPPPTAE